MEFNRVTPENLHDAWLLIEPAMWKVWEKSNPNWIPADLYADVRNGDSVLALATVNGCYAGALIYSVEVQPFSYEKAILAEALYVPPSMAKHKVVEAAYQHMVGAARVAGADKIVLRTMRPAFERRLKAMNAKVSMIEYEMEVPHG